MPAKITLTYFPLTGRGEIVRYILNYGGIPYEEKNIMPDKWPEIKPTTIMGHLPYLEVDGRILSETLAICRYLAKDTGLYPDTVWEQAVADMYIDGANDLWLPSYPLWRSLYQENNRDKANEEFIKYKAEHLKPFLQRYTGFLTQNGTGWFVGNKVSWADLYIAETLERFDRGFPGIFGGFPELEAFYDRVQNLPRLKEYLANRKHLRPLPK